MAIYGLIRTLFLPAAPALVYSLSMRAYVACAHVFYSTKALFKAALLVFPNENGDFQTLV